MYNTEQDIFTNQKVYMWKHIVKGFFDENMKTSPTLLW